MLWLYRLLFPFGLIVLAPRYLRRMRRRGGYRENFAQRFGSVDRLAPRRPGVRRIWVQAVSVGEMLAIGPILEALRQEDGVEVYLTTTTSTGYRLARVRYAGLVIGIGYFPLDWWPFSRRAWRAIAPDLAILTEGERWPEHVAQARSRGVPVVCINARMSDRSYRRMRSVRSVVQPLFDGLSRVLTSSPQDLARFVELGYPMGRVAMTGNLKLDVSIPRLTPAERSQLRRELGFGPGLVLLGSSTWPGEEAALLEAWREARVDGLPISLLLVPRHAERREEIADLLTRSGVTWHLRSRGQVISPDPVEIAVADTTGELRQLTQLADLVFVGKSLPPHTEGQTPVEAAALHKPILFGTGMGNFRQIAGELADCGAARVVTDVTRLPTTVTRLLRDEVTRAQMSANAAYWHQANQGATERTLLIIREELQALKNPAARV